MAASPQQFCLRWNNHQSNIVSVFEQLLHSEAFVDVTLAVEGMSLKAHKVVLSACSPYFQAVLASHPDKHPIVILKDVRYGDMRDLLDFMYRGEVSVDQDNLSSFLKVAESLRIKGLTEVNEKKRRESSSSPYLLHQGIAMTSSCPTIPIGSPSAETLKRPLLSPTFGHNKRRRGRPPKISGDESDGETANNSTGDADCSDVRTDAEEKAIKVEAEDPKDDVPEEARDGECRTNGSSRSSGDSPIKDEQRNLKTDSEITTESPGSGNGPVTSDWPNTEYEQDESSHSSSSLVLNPTSLANAIHLPTKHPHTPLPPTVTEIDQLYYTKNLLEAAMLKNPYEALKNDKAFHGSILLETLRAPMKFGFHAVYGNREIDRDISSSPLSPHTSSPLKPSQSSPTSQSPSSRSHNSSNLNSKGQPQSIMSHCIQDNGFKCSKCLQTFTHPSNFHRHYITVHTDRRAHKCHVCGKEFKRKDNMMSHIRSVHRPGKEGHTIFRDMSTVSPSLTRNVSPLQEQLLQQVDKV